MTSPHPLVPTATTMLPTCTDLDHEVLNYHGHSDCLNPHIKSGPYHWIIYTWPCRVCRQRFAWMLVAEGIDEDGDWSGRTAKGPVFRVPTLAQNAPQADCG